jgi:cytoskeletal protein CcmA (bactofilin family)
MTTTHSGTWKRQGIISALMSYLQARTERFRIQPAAYPDNRDRRPFQSVDAQSAKLPAHLAVRTSATEESEFRRHTMVFRKESRHDAFQRQISALRQQLSADQEDDIVQDDAEPMPPHQFSPESESDHRQESPPMIPLEQRPASAETGVIAAGSSWSGTLQSDGSIHVFGNVDGEILAADDVFVAEGAEVDAKVTATNVIVAGNLGGTVECTGRMEVWPTGHVSGDIRSPRLIVHEGARIDGTVGMEVPNNTD